MATNDRTLVHRPAIKMSLLRLCYWAKEGIYEPDDFAKLPAQSGYLEVNVAALVQEYKEQGVTLCSPECFPADVILVGIEEAFQRAWSGAKMAPPAQWPGTETCKYCGANQTYMKCVGRSEEFYSWFCAPCCATQAVAEYLHLIPHAIGRQARTAEASPSPDVQELKSGQK